MTMRPTVLGKQRRAAPWRWDGIIFVGWEPWRKLDGVHPMPLLPLFTPQFVGQDRIMRHLAKPNSKGGLK